MVSWVNDVYYQNMAKVQIPAKVGLLCNPRHQQKWHVMSWCFSWQIVYCLQQFKGYTVYSIHMFSLHVFSLLSNTTIKVLQNSYRERTTVLWISIYHSLSSSKLVLFTLFIQGWFSHFLLQKISFLKTYTAIYSIHQPVPNSHLCSSNCTSWGSLNAHFLGWPRWSTRSPTPWLRPFIAARRPVGRLKCQSFRGIDSNYWFLDPPKKEHSIGLRMVEHKKQMLEGNTPHFPSVASNLGKLKQTVILTSYFNSKLPIYAKMKSVYYTAFPKSTCCTLKNMQNNCMASTNCGAQKTLGDRFR